MFCEPQRAMLLLSQCSVEKATIPVSSIEVIMGYKPRVFLFMLGKTVVNNFIINCISLILRILLLGIFLLSFSEHLFVPYTSKSAIELGNNAFFVK